MSRADCMDTADLTVSDLPLDPSDITTNALLEGALAGVVADDAAWLHSLADDCDTLEATSANDLLKRVRHARNTLALVQGAFARIEATLEDALDCLHMRADEDAYLTQTAEPHLQQATREVAEIVGDTFVGQTVGDCERFLARHRLAAGAPYVLAPTPEQRDRTKAICDALRIDRPYLRFRAEADAFIARHRDAYRAARVAHGKTREW